MEFDGCDRSPRLGIDLEWFGFDPARGDRLDMCFKVLEHLVDVWDWSPRVGIDLEWFGFDPACGDRLDMCFKGLEHLARCSKFYFMVLNMVEHLVGCSKFYFIVLGLIPVGSIRITEASKKYNLLW